MNYICELEINLQILIKYIKKKAKTKHFIKIQK